MTQVTFGDKRTHLFLTHLPPQLTAGLRLAWTAGAFPGWVPSIPNPCPRPSSGGAWGLCRCLQAASGDPAAPGARGRRDGRGPRASGRDSCRWLPA